MELSCYATFSISIETKKVMSFKEGLNFVINLSMARETEIRTNFIQAVEIAQRINRICGQGSKGTMDKRSCHLGGFNGTSSGGKSHFGRGYASRPIHSTLQVSHGAPVSHSSHSICSR